MTHYIDICIDICIDIYIDIYIDIDIYKLTERPVVLLNAIFFIVPWTYCLGYLFPVSNIIALV